MPRTIMSEKLEKSAATVKQKNGEDVKNLTPNDEESTIVTAAELKKLFNEWDASGKNDLSINSSLADRINQYLDYQRKLDPLRHELASRIYKPYLIEDDDLSHELRDLYVNDEFIATISAYKRNSTCRLVTISDFKIILMALNNPYAVWIDQKDDNLLDEYVDYFAFIVNNGGTVEESYYDSSYCIKINI